MAKEKLTTLENLTYFLSWITRKFSAIGHKHTKSEITDLVVDSALSETSENPVQNKAVKAAVQTLEDSKADRDELGAFYVNITDNGDGTFSADKTYAAIGEALTNKYQIIAMYDSMFMPLLGVADDGVLMFSFNVTLDGEYGTVYFFITQNNEISMQVDVLTPESLGALPSDTFIPAKTSDLTNDSGFLTSSTVPVKSVNGKIGVVNLTYSDVGADASGAASAVQSNLNAVDDKVDDHIANCDIHFTSEERNKLSGIATGANKYTHPNSGVTAGTYKSVTVNAAGHVTGGTNPTTLSGFGITDAYTTSQVDSKIATSLSSAKTYADGLIDEIMGEGAADTLNTIGEISAAIEENQDAVDLLNTAIGNKVDKVSGKGLSTNDYTTTEKTKLAGIATGAEVNQNAFSNIIVGSTTVAADSKTDSVTFTGENITITGDTTNDKINFVVPTGSTSAKGIIQLTNSTSSTSTTTAATPNSVKSAYDLANTAKTTADGKSDIGHKHTVSEITDLTATATELNYMDGVTSNVQTQLDGKAASGHTHNYAGSSSAGGSATSAVKLDTSTAGSKTQPVYFSGGKPVATTYTLGKSVPSDAKFTDTTYTLGSFGITATSTELNVLDGITATTAELNYVDGVTSNIQTQLNAKAASSDLANYLPLTGGTVSGTLTANKIVASSFTANCNANVQNLEFFPGTSASHGGFIDFHYNSSSSDYTSRIIETASGTLTADTHLKVRNDTSYTTAKCRNIYANTKAMTANSSYLENGTIYLQYT